MSKNGNPGNFPDLCMAIPVPVSENPRKREYGHV